MLPTTGDEQSPPAARPRGLVRALWDRFGHLVHELSKFGVVGITAFAVDSAIYWGLLKGGMETLTAKTVATVISATLAFIGNRFWTWRHRERSGLAREYGLYFFLNAVGLGITLVVVAISHYGLGRIWPGVFTTDLADLIAGQIAGNAVATLFRFWSYRRFVFMAPAAPGAEVAVPAAEPAVPARATDRN